MRRSDSANLKAVVECKSTRKRIFKEVIDRLSNARLEEIRNIKLARKSTQLRRMAVAAKTFEQLVIPRICILLLYRFINLYKYL